MDGRIFKHDQRECRGCDAPGGWKNQSEPQLVDRREQVLSIVDGLPDHFDVEGVVQGGTATILREVGSATAKTGTTVTERTSGWLFARSRRRALSWL